MVCTCRHIVGKNINWFYFYINSRLTYINRGVVVRKVLGMLQKNLQEFRLSGAHNIL